MKASKQRILTEGHQHFRKLYGDPRAVKRHERKGTGHTEVYNAYLLGEFHRDCFQGRPKRNPYPKGRRHDAYEQAYHLPVESWNPYKEA